MAAITAWEWALHRSPIATPLQSIVSDCHIEKVKMYVEGVGYWPQIQNPRTFSEKIVHRKLFTDEPKFTDLSDKWAVRKYVADRVGDHVLSEVYYVTDDPETIPFADLPQSFVLKPNHASQMIRIVDDIDTVDLDSMVDEAAAWLSETFGEETNEYWYPVIDPKVIVEERLELPDGSVPKDYKFLVFDGTVRAIQVDFDRFGDHKRCVFNRDWEPFEVTWNHPLGPTVNEPSQFEEMIDVAEALGDDFDFVRVDLYNPGNDVVFGEMTFAPEAGYNDFQPTEFDFTFGEWW